MGEAGEGSQGREAARWLVDPVPVVDIAGTASNGDLVFEYPSGATRLSSGAIVIADGMGAAVRFFDASGQPTHTVGRKGEGPGEFRRIEWLGQCRADSVFAWDSRQDRVTVIDAAGNVARLYRLPADPAAPPPTVINCSRSGVFLLLGLPRDLGPLKRSGESVHYRAPLSLADTRGRATREIGEVAAFEGRPLGKISSIAVSADRVYVGTKDSAFVDVYTLEGEHTAVLPVGVPLRSPTMRHYERAIDAQVSALDAVADRDVLKEMMLEWPMPEHLPPYTALFTDPEGTLWVEISAPGDPDTRLRAVGADGRVVADVHLPVELRVFEVGLDYILAGYEEESGEPHVAMYRMTRGR